MSHVETMECVITSTTAAEKAINEMGGIFEKADNYIWYGRHVGDYPLPAGVKKEDLGKCKYKARFPDVRYEIGFIDNPNGEGMIAIYDFFDRKLSEKVGGPKGYKLKQAITKHQTIEAAEKKGLKWKEVKKENKTTIRVFMK